MIVTFVVAAGEGNEIGAQGKLLWQLPRDMQFFKKTTIGHCVLMGRKTYESLPPKFRPLPDRTNIVLTRNKYVAAGTVVVNNLQQALNEARSRNESELMVIGGGEIYRSLFASCDKLLLTRVHARFPQADTFLPEIKDSEWKQTQREFHGKDDKNPFDMEFITYERIATNGSI